MDEIETLTESAAGAYTGHGEPSNNVKANRNFARMACNLARMASEISKLQSANVRLAAKVSALERQVAAAKTAKADD